MTLAAIGFFLLKFVIFFVLVVFCVAIGALIAVSMLFFTETHFDNMFLELALTIIPTVLWCVFSVGLIGFVIEKLSTIY